MITSLFFTIIGNISLAASAIFDKFILTKSVKSPEVYTFYSTFFFFALFFLLPWCAPVTVLGFWWMLLSGVAYGCALWAMFIALRYGEASHILPFLGAVVAIAISAVSFLLLGEVLSTRVLLGILFLAIGSFLLSFEKSELNNGFHKGFLWAILAGILFCISHVSAKYAYGLYPFFTSLVWTKGLVGVVGLFLLLIPNIRKAIFSKSGTEESPKGSVSTIILGKFFGFAGVGFVQYATALGSVVVVNALGGIQYVFMFAFIYLLTKLKPKLFSEYFTRGEITMEVTAIVLMIIGLLFVS